MNILDEIKYIVEKFRNTTKTAEGSNLPPKQQGAFRVPFVSGFTLLQQSTTPSGSNLLTFGFTPPPDPYKQIDQYEIHACTMPGTPTTFVVGSGTSSPITVEMKNVTANTPHIFYCQTYLKNGLAGDLLSSPTCTATLTPQNITAPIIVDVNGVKVTIDGITVNGVLAGVVVADDTTGDNFIIFPKGVSQYKVGGPNRTFGTGQRVNGGVTGGILRMYDGTGAGGLHGDGSQVELDGTLLNGVAATLNGALMFNNQTLNATARVLQGYIPVVADATGTIYYTPLYL